MLLRHICDKILTNTSLYWGVMPILPSPSAHDCMMWPVSRQATFAFSRFFLVPIFRAGWILGPFWIGSTRKDPQAVSAWPPGFSYYPRNGYHTVSTSTPSTWMADDSWEKKKKFLPFLVGFKPTTSKTMQPLSLTELCYITNISWHRSKGSTESGAHLETVRWSSEWSYSNFERKV